MYLLGYRHLTMIDYPIKIEYLYILTRNRLAVNIDSFLFQLDKEYSWGLSSAGRASALQAEGQRFDPVNSH